MPSFVQECYSCKGTGLYSGFAEAKGEAVVCLVCNGSGGIKQGYTEFNGRKRKRGIKVIHRSQGTFIGTGVGPVGESMTYAEFEKAYKAYSS